MNPVFLYYPNLIGYFRVASAIAAMYFSLTNWQLTAVLYAVSQVLPCIAHHHFQMMMSFTIEFQPVRAARRVSTRLTAS